MKGKSYNLTYNLLDRSSPEGSKKQQFIDFCQKAGIVEVLPYHECDVISRDRPDYLFCLTRLQIQNASVRFPVFITGESFYFC